MAASSKLMITEAERRFPVRVLRQQGHRQTSGDDQMERS
jgi:hypothetical protein